MAWRGQSQRAKEALTDRETVLTNAVEKMNQQCVPYSSFTNVRP